MSECHECTLGDVLTLQRGFDITRAMQAEGNVPVVSSSGINSFHDTAKVDGPGVVIGRKGSLGTCFYLDQAFWPHDTTLWVKDFKGNDPKFCYYFLQRMDLAAHDVGAANPTLNRNHVHLLRVSVPDVDTQRRIASILGAYDDLIEVNRRRIAVLEEMARGLFEGLVTKVIGKLPPASGGFGNAVLPDGWYISDLGDIAEIIMGQSPRSEELNKDGDGFPFHQGVTDFGPLFPRRRVFCVPSNKKKIAAIGDILFSVRAPVGRINLATEAVVLGRGVSSFRSAIGTQHYLAAHLRATFYEPDLIGNGAIYKAVGRNDIQRIPITLPPAEIRNEVNTKIASIYDFLRVLEQSNNALATSRDLLLPRLISGQLSVAEAERELEAAA